MQIHVRAVRLNDTIHCSLRSNVIKRSEPTVVMGPVSHHCDSLAEMEDVGCTDRPTLARLKCVALIPWNQSVKCNPSELTSLR